MMELIDGFREGELLYDDRLNFYCVKNCYWNVLSLYQVPHAPLFLNAELGMVVQTNDKNPLDFAVGLVHDPLLSSQQWHEQQIRGQRIPQALHDFVEFIRNGLPVIIAVDGCFLPYHENYRQKHEQHSILINGLDLEKGIAQVTDYFPPAFYQGTVLICELEESYLNLWSFLQKEKWNSTPEELLRENLRHVFDTMTQAPQAVNQLYGEKAFLFLSKILRMMDDESIGSKTIFRHVHEQLNKYSNKLRFWQFYLQRACQFISSDKIDRLLEEVNRQVKAWGTFTVTILRNAYSGQMNHLFCRQFDNIVSSQPKLLEILSELII